jgi:hypothetical protein
MPLGYNKTNADLAQQLILQYDVIYTGFGLAGEMIENDTFSFNSFFHAILGPGLSLLLGIALKMVRFGCVQYVLTRYLSLKLTLLTKKGTLPVITRRFLWLISCYAHKVDMNISSPYHPVSLLVSVLYGSQNDACIRLTAVQSLEALLPYCEERPDLMQSIVEHVIPSVYDLTGHCSEVENRQICLELISTLIAYVTVAEGELSNNTLDAIASPLTCIWTNAVDQNLLLKRNVLGILSSIASYVGPNQAPILHPMALPMIDDSFQSDDCVFLVEEALKLWFTLLRLSKEYDTNLRKLFIHLAKLSNESEHTA